MNENMPTGPTPEELQLQSELEQCAQFEKDHPELFKKPEALKECGPEIAEFEGLVASFEAAHSLVALHEIIDLTAEQAATHPIRQPAKVALEPIFAKMRILKEETDIAAEKLAEMKAHYKRLSQAVGIINSGKVDHTR